jgi:hypothetical protein
VIAGKPEKSSSLGAKVSTFLGACGVNDLFVLDESLGNDVPIDVVQTGTSMNTPNVQRRL